MGSLPWQHCPRRQLAGGLAELVRSTVAVHSQPTASRSLCPGGKERYRDKSTNDQEWDRLKIGSWHLHTTQCVTWSMEQVHEEKSWAKD